MASAEQLDRLIDERSALEAELSRLKLLVDHLAYLLETPGRRVGGQSALAGWLRAAVEQGARSDEQFAVLLGSAADLVRSS